MPFDIWTYMGRCIRFGPGSPKERGKFGGAYPGPLWTTITTVPVYRPLFKDNRDKSVPERWNQSVFQWGKRWWVLGKQWHQLGHMQTVCTSHQTDNQTSTSSLNFLRARCSSWDLTDSFKALMAHYKVEGIWHEPKLFAQWHQRCSLLLSVLQQFA